MTILVRDVNTLCHDITAVNALPWRLRYALPGKSSGGPETDKVLIRIRLYEVFLIFCFARVKSQIHAVNIYFDFYTILDLGIEKGLEKSHFNKLIVETVNRACNPMLKVIIVIT